MPLSWSSFESCPPGWVAVEGSAVVLVGVGVGDSIPLSVGVVISAVSLVALMVLGWSRSPRFVSLELIQSLVRSHCSRRWR